MQKEPSALPKGAKPLMHRISESLVERYVGFPDTLDAATRAYVEGQIHADEATRRVAAFYRDYYEELNRLMTPSRMPGGSEQSDTLLKGPASPFSGPSAQHQMPHPHPAPEN